MNIKELLLLEAEYWLLRDECLLSYEETNALNALYDEWKGDDKWSYGLGEELSWFALLIAEAIE